MNNQNNINIPLFRSYELDTAILRVGYYVRENGYFTVDNVPDLNCPRIRHYIIDAYGGKFEIADEYLSIHFQDMNDGTAWEDRPEEYHYVKEGDWDGVPIFASLNPKGLGGDILDSDDYPFTDADGRKNYNAIAMIVFNSPQYVYQKISEEIRGISDGINVDIDGSEDWKRLRVMGVHHG